MNLFSKLQQRQAEGKPLRVGLIGAGKFAAMYLAQVSKTPGVHLVGIADLVPAGAKTNLERVGWKAEQFAATSLDHAMAKGSTRLDDDWEKLVAHPGIDIIVECTGNPIAAVEHCLAAFAHGKHVVNVTVEADALCGPLLARRAQAAGVVYSLAYGDQPALICDLVDWARAAGFQVVAAGRGHKWLPHFAESTPETVWGHYGLTPEQAQTGGLNPKMFNSFVDGTKSGIEMTAVCNATGLIPQSEGLGFPPASRFELADVCKPRSDGGTLEKAGVTEVVSSVYRDGRDVPHHLALGTYVVFEGESEYARRCFKEYAMLPDQSGRYAALYRPIHMIGLELGVSVASAALRREPTGAPTGFRSDAVATAKRNLKAGEVLDGEGGFCVWGKQTPAERSLAAGLLPLGLAHNVTLKRDIAEGERLKWSDVAYDASDLAVKVRREMEAAFGRQNVAAETGKRM